MFEKLVCQALALVARDSALTGVARECAAQLLAAFSDERPVGNVEAFREIAKILTKCEELFRILSSWHQGSDRTLQAMERALLNYPDTNFQNASDCDHHDSPSIEFQVVSLRNAPPVEEQPKLELLQWRVFESRTGVLILNGFLVERPTIRTTTPIVAVVGCCVTTVSGRQYQLIGEPAADPQVLELISQKMLLAGHANYADVTDAFWTHCATKKEFVRGNWQR